MQPKELNEISQDIRATYEKAVQAMDKNNTQYAIDLFLTILSHEPCFLLARAKLRDIEISMVKKSIFSKMLSSFDINKNIKTAQLNLVRKKYNDALQNIEKALAVDIKNLGALKTLADIGKAIEADFIVTEAYELAYRFHPDNLEVILLLAEWYRKLDRGQDELKLRNKISQMFPDKIEYKSEMRSAAASAMMEKQRWEARDGGSYRNMLKNEKEAAELEQKERIIHDKDDASLLIKKYESQLCSASKDEDKAKVLKELGWLYYKSGIYDKAMEFFEQEQKISGIFDLVIDQAMENSRISIIDSNLAECNKYLATDLTPEQKEEILKNLSEQEALKKQIKRFHAENRVKIYPHDLQLRYKLALFYWEESLINEAIEQFQLSQRHPQVRDSSLIYLGRCFLMKKHYDLAVEQFKKVLENDSELPDDIKLECLYNLAEAYELLEDKANALGNFKRIYSINAKYRDVIARIEKYYE